MGQRWSLARLKAKEAPTGIHPSIHHCYSLWQLWTLGFTWKLLFQAGSQVFITLDSHIQFFFFFCLLAGSKCFLWRKLELWFVTLFRAGWVMVFYFAQKCRLIQKRKVFWGMLPSEKHSMGHSLWQRIGREVQTVWECWAWSADLENTSRRSIIHFCMLYKDSFSTL